MNLVNPDNAEETKEMYSKGVTLYYRSVGNNITVYDGSVLTKYMFKYLAVKAADYEIYKSKLGKCFYY